MKTRIVIFLVTLMTVGCTNLGTEIKSDDSVKTEIWIDAGGFSISKFAEEIKQNSQFLFDEPITLGNGKDKAEIINAVEIQLFEIYGESNIKRQRPYSIYEDFQHEYWWLQGNDSYLNGGLGGVINAIIKIDSRELIAAWHGE